MNKHTPAAPIALKSADSFQMNRILRHKLRNHSAGLKMTLFRIQEVLERTSPEMADRCSLMLDELEGLESFTERMDLAFSDLPVTEPCMLFNLICELRRRFAAAFPLCNLDLEGPECAAQFIRGNYIAIALWELMSNAGEAAGFEGHVTLKWELNEKITFTVSNSGDTFPKNIPTSPPIPFHTDKGRHDGLGLAIVNRISNSLGGIFSVLPQGIEGTVTQLELPREELNNA